MATWNINLTAPGKKFGDVADQTAMLAVVGIEPTQWVHRLDTGTAWQYQGTDPSVLANWEEWPYPEPFDPSTLGLGTAAYANTTAFDAAGAATTAEGNAKAYASQEADTIYIPGVLLNGTITVLFHARHAGKVVSLTHQLEGGTCSLTAKIGGSNIIGIASVGASTTKTTSTATAASTYSAGAIIEVTIASVSSAKGLRLALYRNRAV